nr:Xanthine dehydrogenase [Chromera velia]
MEVRVEYEDLPAILSIPEAIAASSFFDLRPGLPGRDHLHLCRLEGDVDGEMPKEEREGERMELLMGSLEGRSDIQIVEGEVFMKGQEHFYLETNACRVEPGENDEMTVTSSTQNPSKTQKLVSEVTGLPRHKIVSKCKRMGGGFGGKETRSCFIAAYVAIAAQHLQKPIRLMMDRDTDMLSSGQRHSFMGSYKVAINRNTLRLEAADVRVYNNAGWSTDLSVPVCERAVFHIENACMISNLQVRGFVCKTNTPSNTAFRGFGGPQGMFIAETYIEHAAKALGVSREDVLSRNLYRQNDLTHYGMRIQTDTLHEVWGKAMTQFDFEKRKKEVEAFNASNRFVKRGLAVSLSKFGMSFTKTFMNQSGALVHLYQDGTLLVSHAGTEMGQGLHTKVAQVAASRFGLPLSAVYISETSTDKVANTQPTAASVGADLAGMATFIACGQILERLSDFVETEERKAKEKRENVDRQTIIARAATAAHFARVNLTGQGFYATPDVAFDWQRGRGRPFYYFAHGISCSEVQLDTLTGDHAVIRADIIQDVGSSLNPAIDVGQVEGAFTQGLGLFTLEETVFNDKGGMFTKGPGAYKIPSFGDIPHDFRVSLLGKPNTEVETVYSSKGVGEPPLFLASSVFFALKNAAYAARRDHTEAMTNGALKEAPAKDPTDTWHFRLDSPASSEKLRLACWDPLNHSLPEELRGRSLLASSPVLAEREKGKKGEGPERQGVEGSREAARERLEGICKKSVSKPNTVWHPLI